MQSEIVFGNAVIEGASRRGWFVGHFITPCDRPNSTADLEVKWAVHTAREGRPQWAMNTQSTTLSILIQGRFRVQFPDREVILSREGDYVLWTPGVSHWWLAEEDSTILTVRWPSESGDSVEIKN